MANAWLSERELKEWAVEILQLNNDLSSIDIEGSTRLFPTNSFITAFLQCFTAKYSQRLVILTRWLIGLTIVLGLLALANIITLLNV